MILWNQYKFIEFFLNDIAYYIMSLFYTKTCEVVLFLTTIPDKVLHKLLRVSGFILLGMFAMNDNNCFTFL